MDATEILTQTRTSIAAATERFADLVVSARDLSVPAHRSRWSVRDVSAHLIVAGGLLTDIAQGVPSPVTSFDPAYFGPEADRRIADVPESDPGKLSRLLVDTVEGFLEATSDRAGNDAVVFHCGIDHTVAGIAGVLLGEVVLHGYDVATALRRPWPINPVDAQLILGAYAPVFASTVHPERTRGLSAGFGVELRGGADFTVRFTDGIFGLEEAGTAPVDATISADPIAFLMIGTGRLDRYAAAALGLLSVGGDQPELALAFHDLFVYP